MFCTRTNKLEIDIEGVEREEKEIQRLRREMGHNVFKRLYVQLKKRTLFMATPPVIWFFLILLGIFSAITLYVGRACAAGGCGRVKTVSCLMCVAVGVQLHVRLHPVVRAEHQGCDSEAIRRLGAYQLPAGVYARRCADAAFLTSVSVVTLAGPWRRLCRVHRVDDGA